MDVLTKLFPTELYKEVTITPILYQKLVHVRITFQKSTAIVLFEGTAQLIEFNHVANRKFLPICVNVNSSQIIIVIKGKFQLKTFIEGEVITKYVIEKMAG